MHPLLVIAAMMILSGPWVGAQESIDTAGSAPTVIENNRQYRVLQKLPPQRLTGHDTGSAHGLGRGMEGIETVIHDWSDEKEYDAEIHAVVNPLDSTNIVAAAMTYDGITVYATHDFGRTWKQSIRVIGGDPVLAADHDGTLYLFYLRGQVFYRYSSDGGRSWQRPANDTVDIGGKGPDKPWVAVDRFSSAFKGSLYVVLASDDGSRQQLVLRTKRGGEPGFSTSETVLLDDSFILQQFASIDVSADGGIHVAFWGQRYNDPATGIWYVHSSNGGATFSPPVKVADLAGTVNEIFGPRFQIPGKVAPGPVIQIAVDNSTSAYADRIYVIWNDKRRVGEKFATDILLAYSPNGGSVWSDPQRLNDDLVGQVRHHFLPTLTVNPDGVVCTSWYDGRASEDNSNVHVSAAYSANGGLTFTPNIRATSVPTDLDAVGEEFQFSVGHYTQVVATGHYLIPFWSDGRDLPALNLYCAFLPITGGASRVERIESLDDGEEGLSILHDRRGNPSAIVLDARDGAGARVTLLDMRGESLRVLFDGEVKSRRPIELGTEELSSGVYLVMVESAGGVTSRYIRIIH